VEDKSVLKKMTMVLATSVAAMFAATNPGMAQTKLKWAHVYETSEPFHTASVWAAQEIGKRTNGRYTVDVYPASQLGKEADINQGLSLGSVDIIISGSSFAAKSFPPIGVLSLHLPRRRPSPCLHQERHLQGARQGL
jgi:TRAP-type C4-dicarboxylate transport system substrate-binding protein